MTFQLFQDLTPQTVAKIEQFVTLGFYTSPTQPTSTSTPSLPDKNFHRIVPGFVAQAGSKTGDGTGSSGLPGTPFSDEFNQQLVFDGTAQLAMANAGDDTNDSQFFITYGPQRNLDFNHTIFGQLVSGMDTLLKMENVAKTSQPVGGEVSKPVTPVLITGTTLSNTNPNGVVHINTINAKAGETANVTVTATDSMGASISRTFQVNVTANVDVNGQPLNEPAFLNPVQNLVVATNQTAVFQLTATNPEPTDTLTYIVKGGVQTDPTTGVKSFTNVQNATASVDANGTVTVVPNANFTGVINLLVGVRDNVLHPGRSTTLDDPNNFDTQQITLTVRNGAIVNLPPIAANGSTQVTANQPAQLQLPGLTANPGQPSQTLTYELLTQPTHGTITNFDPTKGTFTYTPNAGYLGQDTVGFRVRDNGAPTPNLTSQPGTFTINVTGTDTGAVRFLDGVLIVTPPPRTDHGTNTVNVKEVNGAIQVEVNGLIDTNSPTASNVNRIVVYGTKANDKITIDQNVTIPTTLSGGLGGVNTIQAGGGMAREHGWFGRNTLTGGPLSDALYGRKGHVRFVKSGGNDLLFAGMARLGRKHGQLKNSNLIFKIRPLPPTGTFYRFVGNRIVPIPTPKLTVQRVRNPRIGDHTAVQVASTVSPAQAHLASRATSHQSNTKK